MSELVLHTADGLTLPATLSHPVAELRGAVVIAPALGVPRRFYARFGEYLAQRGYAALCFDYRGIDGAGAEQAAEQIRLEHWGERDLEAALLALREQFDARRLFLVGHSIGGQLPGLAPSAERLAGMVFVAASLPHPSRYRGRDRLQIELMWRVLVPLFGRGRRFPARRLGFASVDLPSSVMRQWAAWGLKPDYLFDPVHGLDVSRYAKLPQPVLAYSFADDSYASRSAVEALLARYTAARIERRHIERKPGFSYGHFGYFRDAQRDALWRDTADWLDRV